MPVQAAEQFVMTEQLWHHFEQNYARYAELKGFGVCRERWRFYYDETGNFRRIAYKNGTVPDARSVTQDFIVGGLAFASDGAVGRAVSLAQNLPAPQGELKSKTVLGGSKDFAKTLGRREVTQYLDVLDDGEVFVHYIAQNNFYYAIVDIVDSLLHFGVNRHLVEMHWDLKDALFNVLKGNPKGVLDRLFRYGYPNVEGENVRPFCHYLSNSVAAALTDELENDDPWAWSITEILRQMLKAAEKEGQLFFLEDNEDNVLINDFLHNYMQGCCLFPESHHVFDMEMAIARTLGQKANNYEFVNSKGSVPVQLSDVFVGLLGRLFTYLDGLNSNTVDYEAGRFKGDALRNLSRIRSAIYRARAKHVALVNAVNAVSAIRWREEALAILCNV